MPWLTQQVRVTVFFPSRLAQPPAVPSWQQLAGAEPEQTLRRPGVQLEIGPYGNGRLQVARQLPLRADLVYTPSPAREGADLANLGPPPDAVASTADLARRFATSVGAVVRLAVGVQAFYPTESLESAHNELPRLLPLHQLDLRGVSEFLMQINRPRPSQALDGVMINRIGKWLPAQVTLTALDETGRAGRVSMLSGVQVETDVSTDAERDESLDADHVPALLQELFSRSLEIIEAGDQR